MSFRRSTCALLPCLTVVASSALLTPAAQGVVRAAIIAAPSTDGATAVRLNVRCGAYADTAARVWSAESGVVGGRTSSVAGSAVEGTDDDVLFQSLRMGMSALEAAVSVSGRCRLSVHMKEKYHAVAGRRVFSATAERAPVFTDLDLVAAAGAQAA